MNMRSVIAAVLLSAAASTSFAAGLTTRSWELDVRSVERDVIAPLNEQYQQVTDPDSWKEYGIDFLSRIRVVRDSIHPDSYHLLRNSVLTSIEDLSDLPNETLTWKQAEQYIRTKINFIADVLTIVGCGTQSSF